MQPAGNKIKAEAFSAALNRGVTKEIICNTSPADETIPYELRGLDPSRYSVRLKTEDFEIPPLYCDIGPGETRIMDIVLERVKGVINGKVTGMKAPADYSAVKIMLSRWGDQVSALAPVDTGAGGNTGAYRIPNLGTGQYVLIANKWLLPGYPTGEYPSIIKQVFVASGETAANVDFNFTAEMPGAAGGLVSYTGTKGYNLEGRMVFAVPASSVIYGAQSGWQSPIQPGNLFLIRGLMPGAYKIFSDTNLDTHNDRYGKTVPDAICQPALVHILEGETKIVGLTLADGFRIRGNVILPGPLNYEFHCGVEAHIKGPHPEENHCDALIPPGQLSAQYEIVTLAPADYVVAVHSPEFIHSAREVKIVNKLLLRLLHLLLQVMLFLGQVLPPFLLI